MFLLFATLLLLSSPVMRAAGSEADVADGEVSDEESEKVPEFQKQQPHQVPEPVDPTAPDFDKIGPSPDAQVTFLFTSAVSNSRELIAGKLVKFLVGFANRGEKDFVVKLTETSFRYPMDFSYHIQNFTAARYERVVQPRQEGSFDYAFIPSEQFIGRPLGLVVNLHYTDADGAFYTHTVFNETVHIVEDENAFSTETGFLYVVLAGLGVALVAVGHHYLSRFTRKQTGVSYHPPAHETGTNKNEVDYEWIPREHFAEKKSPKLGSPRNRRPAKAD